MLDQAETERVKLLANSLDRASTAMLTLGVFAPIAAAIYAPPQPAASVLVYLFGAVFWLTGAYIFHWFAARVLGRLGI